MIEQQRIDIGSIITSEHQVDGRVIAFLCYSLWFLENNLFIVTTCRGCIRDTRYSVSH